ncbi:putative late competence protein comFA [Listeria cornellensis FSL F6-0969]|uniref:Putative late competence protein comFA n=1 Tax=Listeria cornellensis FSL F6-0969 TaxID=1265820 RepID=W7CHT2_9LIST|nr:putative late competence protein comFA [Listeria cornellensis FSL F6-0969]
MQTNIEGRLFSKEEIPDTKNMQQVKAVEVKENKKMCLRCGNNQEELFFRSPCSHCGSENCWYCRNCIIMGKMTECGSLFYFPGRTSISSRKSNYLAWKGELSPGQKIASAKVHHAVVEKENLLLWAVAGSGKTEMMFEGMNEVLINGGRLCVASLEWTFV